MPIYFSYIAYSGTSRMVFCCWFFIQFHSLLLDLIPFHVLHEKCVTCLSHWILFNLLLKCWRRAESIHFTYIQPSIGSSVWFYFSFQFSSWITIIIVLWILWIHFFIDTEQWTSSPSQATKTKKNEKQKMNAWPWYRNGKAIYSSMILLFLFLFFLFEVAGHRLRLKSFIQLVASSQRKRPFSIFGWQLSKVKQKHKNTLTKLLGIQVRFTGCVNEWVGMWNVKCKRFLA